jgi:hypothetical protein
MEPEAKNPGQTNKPRAKKRDNPRAHVQAGRCGPKRRENDPAYYADVISEPRIYLAVYVEMAGPICQKITEVKGVPDAEREEEQDEAGDQPTGLNFHPGRRSRSQPSLRLVAPLGERKGRRLGKRNQGKTGSEAIPLENNPRDDTEPAYDGRHEKGRKPTSWAETFEKTSAEAKRHEETGVDPNRNWHGPFLARLPACDN